MSGVIVGVVLAVSLDILVFCARSHRRCGPGCGRGADCSNTCVHHIQEKVDITITHTIIVLGYIMDWILATFTNMAITYHERA